MKIKYLVLSLLSFFLALPVLAQESLEFENLSFPTEEVDKVTKAAPVAVAGVGIMLLLIWIVVMVILVAFFIFWLVMLIDCVKRDFEQKTTWLIILIVSWVIGLFWLAAIIYYFVVKKKNLGTPKVPAGETFPSKKTPPTPPTSSTPSA